MFMSGKELMAVLRVIASLSTATILEVNIGDIVISIHKWRFVDKNTYISLLRKYHTNRGITVETRVRQFYSFLEEVLQMLSFEHFNRMLKAAGQYKLSNIIIAETNGVSQSCPLKRQMPHAELIQEYFANLKRYADNNWFQDGTRFQLERMIITLGNKLKRCDINVDPEQFQILVDKRVMTYFLLAQQFANMDERLRVMKHMRDSMPHDVDRTLFNVIFHSYMSVIRALKDDVNVSENHEQQARFANHLCLPDIAGVILRLCIQYRNNVLFFKRHNRDDLEHASTDFEEIFQMFDSMSKDPQLYGTIAKLEMVHTLLGIDWDLDVCDISRIRFSDIEKGRKVISALKEPSETRREMLFCLCRARLYENVDPTKAQMYAREALSLADDGSYYDIEKTNIQKYIDTLTLKILPSAETSSISKTDILDIIISFRRFGYLKNDADYFSLLNKYSKQNETLEENKKLIHLLIERILPLVTFDDFNNVLVDAGKDEMSKMIIAERNGVSQNWPPKRELPHTYTVHEYFANLKRCADNNSFQDGTLFRLESFIDTLNGKLNHCQGNYGKYQLLVDELVMVYFLLAQQYSTPDERLGVMQRMRDHMPHNVDRTLFDTIFHAYMSVIWSLKDDVHMAERHEQMARYACHSCLPGLVSIILRLCIQYKNNIFYFRRHQSDDLEHATIDFEEIFQMFDYMIGDPKIYGTIAMLEMVHTLLGIDWDLKVCNIEELRSNNLERGREIFSTLQKPPETRRKLLFYLCRARLLEQLDPKKAEKYARKALFLADDGCYYGVEKTNIQNYLDILSIKSLPYANIKT